jgi:DNA-binding SARP family transcriptional activator
MVVVDDSGADPSLRFEILGSLRAMRDDDVLDLGPSKQRAVLAVLLINANRPVSAIQIVGAVWRDDPPENGPNVVQKYVAGLRRVLEPDRSPRAQGRVIRLTDAGYLLEVTPGYLDAGLFDSLVRQAQIDRDEGKLNDAAAELRAALALWRGEAFAGLPGPVLESERRRLAENRADALETVAEIELELGHHTQQVPELGRLVAEFPLREQLRYLLILALYRCGRQTEALAAFRAAREFLAEEFGVEPGERLQRLHERILRSDPTLMLVPGDPPPKDSPTPPPPARRPSQPAPQPPHMEEQPGTVGTSYVPLNLAAGPTAIRTSPAAPPGRTRWRSWLGRSILVALPIVTFGLAGWAIIAYYAARRRSRWLATAAAGYFACSVLFVSLEGEEGSLEENIWGVSLLLASIGCAAHVALLAFEPKGAVPQGVPPGDATEDFERRVRREQARRLLNDQPAIARDLRIGRPDLARAFDDGGLIDINGVPEHVLAGLPGISSQQASLIVADRRDRGTFASTDDLTRRGLLPTPLPDALREILIAVQ